MATTCAFSVEHEQKVLERFSLTTLHGSQKEGLRAVCQGKDLFLGTKTGSGKSLVYEAVPLLYPGHCVLVVAPLTSIMIEQCQRLNNLNFKATYIGRDQEEVTEISEGKFDFIFGSPEMVVGEKKWRDIIKSKTIRDKMKLIVIDEAHTVIQWGEEKDNEEPFRECFSKLCELRSLCPSAQMAALTATSGPAQRRNIMKHLCFQTSACVIMESPDRDNIKISTSCVSNNDNLEDTFQWLIADLKSEREKLPRHVIFCEKITDVAKIYTVFTKHLGKSCEFVNMYHSKTKDNIKEQIRNDMAVNGRIRVLICTNSAGMGVNFHCLNNVVHYGLPREMDTFVQQMGRAGRDGSTSDELIFYKTHKGYVKNVEPDLIRLAKDNSTCRRISLCMPYCVTKRQINPLHNCCDICEKQCACHRDNCPRTHKAFEYAQLNYSTEVENRRTVSAEEKLHLHHKLSSLQNSLSEGSSTLIDPEILHGLTDDVVKNLVENCDAIFTPNDILQKHPIWSYDIALCICNVIYQVFGDYDVYSGHYGSDLDSE